MAKNINDSDIIPPSGITRVILNNEEKNPEDLNCLISTLSNRDILIREKGYIFKSSIMGNCLRFGFLPFFVNGRAASHYEINFSADGQCALFGFIDSNGTLALLFKPNRNTYGAGFLPGMADIFRDNYIRLARFLIENGFSWDFILDFATEFILEKSKLFVKAPVTVKELALQFSQLDGAIYPKR